LADVTFKLCLFGDGGVGKTTLTERYLMGLFSEDTKITLGTSFYQKDISVEGLLVNLQIWDFGGEEQFRALFPNYINGAAGAIFMYDLTRFITLKNLTRWIDKMGETVRYTDIPILMVGGKLDMEEKRAVDKEAGPS